MAEDILVPISVGELLDKLTILEIKRREITAPEKLGNVQSEYQRLLSVIEHHGLKHLFESADVRRLADINQKLWTIEDDIRAHEKRGDFGSAFIALARSVYVTNDERARLKRAINVAAGSTLIEEKSFD